MVRRESEWVLLTLTYQLSELLIAGIEILKFLCDEFIQNASVDESLSQLTYLSPVITRMTEDWLHRLKKKQIMALWLSVHTWFCLNNMNERLNVYVVGKCERLPPEFHWQTLCYLERSLWPEFSPPACSTSLTPRPDTAAAQSSMTTPPEDQ